MLFVSSSWCRGLACSVWLWHFLVQRQILRLRVVYLHLVTGTETQTLMVATGNLDSSADHL